MYTEKIKTLSAINRLVKRTIVWPAIAIFTFLMLLVLLQPVQAADVVVYKNPSCGCCNKWVEHLKKEGFSVEVNNRSDLSSVKSKWGVPANLQACHTAEVGGYLIEGHIPVEDIKRLLAEKPDIKGLVVPGMPMGSPGMEGPRKDPYTVFSLDKKGQVSVFNQH